MIGFILLSIGLIALVMWLIAPALLSQQKAIIDNTKQTNVSIAREKINDLETQLTQGDITQAQFDQARDEIELSLLADTESQDSTKSELPVQYKRNIFVLLTAIPFIAFGLYQYWGEPQAITSTSQVASEQTTNPHAQQASGPQAEHTAGSMEEAIARLETKLQENPDDPNGWYILGRTYMVRKDYTKAAEAFRKLHALAGDQAEVLLGLADALTMSRNGDMRGEPFELAKRALELAPNNPTALWLTGIGHRDNGDYASAISLWKKLLPLLADNPQSTQEVQTLISRAESQLDIAGTAIPTSPSSDSPATSSPLDVAPTATAASITVQVKLDPALRETKSGNDYVMVFAQRVEGMKMPLAMYKAQVKDLPMTVTLNDSLALSPMNKLSGEQSVNVIARISKSSQAIKQAGDIETKIGPIPVTGSEPVTIMITR